MTLENGGFHSERGALSEPDKKYMERKRSGVMQASSGLDDDIEVMGPLETTRLLVEFKK